MSLDLKPETLKKYLKYISEAIVLDSKNEGSLRRDVWDYIYKKWKNEVEYRDFLLAIRKFL